MIISSCLMTLMFIFPGPIFHFYYIFPSKDRYLPCVDRSYKSFLGLQGFKLQIPFSDIQGNLTDNPRNWHRNIIQNCWINRFKTSKRFLVKGSMQDLLASLNVNKNLT